MIFNETTLIYTLAAITTLFGGLLIYLEIRLRRLLRGKDAQTLEDTIASMGKEIDELKRFRTEIESYLRLVEGRLRRAVSGVGTVRFNPFKGSSGSNQSFASAFLSEKGDGVVLSSLYSRDRVSVFAKPVKDNSSEFGLTNEEKEAIQKAGEASKSV